MSRRPNKKKPKARNSGRNRSGLGPARAQPAKQKKSQQQIDPFYLYFTFAVVVLILVILTRIVYFDLPLERDESTYAVMGKMILEGAVPYRDFYEMKPPLMYYSYALIVALFGYSAISLQIALIVVNIAGGVLMFMLAGHFFRREIALLVAALFLLFTLNPHLQGLNMDSEHLILLPVLGGLTLLFQGLKKEKRLLLLVSGALLGVAVLIKQISIVFAVFGLFVIAQRGIGEKWSGQQFVSNLIFYISGGLAILVLTLLLVLIQGTWSDFIYWVIEYPRSYAGGVAESAFDDIGAMWRRMSGFQWPLWLAVLAGLMTTVAFRFELKKKILVWVFLLLSLLSVVPGFRFYGHYWLLVVPAFVLTIGLATEILWNRRWMGVRFSPDLLLAIVAGLTIIHIVGRSGFYFKANTHELSREVFGANPFPEAREIGKHLNSIAGPDDQVVVMGSEPQIYIYADKVCPVKNVFTGLINQAEDRSYQLQQEAVEELKQLAPEYAVFWVHGFSWSFDDNERSRYLYNNSWFYLDDNYEIAGYADILSFDLTNYVFGDNALNYQPQSDFYGIVYRKK